MEDKPYNTTPSPADMIGNNGDSSQLETSKAERHIWLMKCPPVVSRAMHQHQQQPPPPLSSCVPAASYGQLNMAKVIVSVDPLLPSDDFSSTEFTMELTDPAGSKCKLYSMNMSTDVIPMSVFAEASQGKLSVEGKIYHKFDMKPPNENIEDYGKICRERTRKHMTKSRQIQIINNDSGVRLSHMPGVVDIRTSGSANKKKTTTKVSETKRTRRDPEEMEKIMFKLFERQQKWTLKQLVQETDQPEQYLKDMLKVLCVYNNKGTNQGSYELKPEYRRSEDKSDPQ